MQDPSHLQPFQFLWLEQVVFVIQLLIRRLSPLSVGNSGLSSCKRLARRTCQTCAFPMLRPYQRVLPLYLVSMLPGMSVLLHVTRQATRRIHIRIPRSSPRPRLLLIPSHLAIPFFAAMAVEDPTKPSAPMWKRSTPMDSMRMLSVDNPEGRYYSLPPQFPTVLIAADAAIH